MHLGLTFINRIAFIASVEPRVITTLSHLSARAWLRSATLGYAPLAPLGRYARLRSATLAASLGSVGAQRRCDAGGPDADEPPVVSAAKDTA